MPTSSFSGLTFGVMSELKSGHTTSSSATMTHGGGCESILDNADDGDNADAWLSDVEERTEKYFGKDHLAGKFANCEADIDGGFS